jgi:hypothetical protein
MKNPELETAGTAEVEGPAALFPVARTGEFPTPREVCLRTSRGHALYIRV